MGNLKRMLGRAAQVKQRRAEATGRPEEALNLPTEVAISTADNMRRRKRLSTVLGDSDSGGL